VVLLEVTLLRAVDIHRREDTPHNSQDMVLQVLDTDSLDKFRCQILTGPLEVCHTNHLQPLAIHRVVHLMDKDKDTLRNNQHPVDIPLSNPVAILLVATLLSSPSRLGTLGPLAAILVSSQEPTLLLVTCLYLRAREL
jgi:hypothetical protein